MTEMAPTLGQVEAFLFGVHGKHVTGLQSLDGGFWSSAFAYSVEGQELVLRVGSARKGFEMDRSAMAFERPGLPVPEVLEIGEGLGRTYAISARHHGRFLETVRPDEAVIAGSALVCTLDALRAIPAGRDAPSEWYPREGESEGSTWRRWLTDGLVDNPHRRVTGWRKILAADADLDGVFRACEERIGELVQLCPERRDLVHGDLLNRNVLVADDASRITAVYSWKCSVRGDLLYDVAWCTFWGAWHPGIAALDLMTRTVNSPSLSDHALEGAASRHHCYELQIGASHLGWNAWTRNRDELRKVAAYTTHVLARGPLEQPRP
jgi:aminoglycoside phosphotransferase (APT) family kinase protein